MGEPTRGQDVNLDIFRDGQPVLMIQMQSMTRNMDSSEERQQRCGTRLEQPRQKIHGWSGSITYEEEDVTIDDLVDMLVNKYQAGTGVQRIDIIETTYHPESGQTRTYVYRGCTFKVNRNVGGKNDETELTLDWMSAARDIVA